MYQRCFDHFIADGLTGIKKRSLPLFRKRNISTLYHYIEVYEMLLKYVPDKETEKAIDHRFKNRFTRLLMKALAPIRQVTGKWALKYPRFHETLEG